MSCELMLLASMARFLRQPTSASAALAAVVAGLAATIRNAGYVFLPVLLVMALIHWRRLALAQDPHRRGDRAADDRLDRRGTSHRLCRERRPGRRAFWVATCLPRRRSSRRLGRTSPSTRRARSSRTISKWTSRRSDRSSRPRPPSIRSLLTVYYETCLEGPCTREMREATTRLAARDRAEQMRLHGSRSVALLARRASSRG